MSIDCLRILLVTTSAELEAPKNTQFGEYTSVHHVVTVHSQSEFYLTMQQDPFDAILFDLAGPTLDPTRWFARPGPHALHTPIALLLDDESLAYPEIAADRLTIQPGWKQDLERWFDKVKK